MPKGAGRSVRRQGKARGARAGKLAKLCPTVERAFDVLGRKWAGLVIRELSTGERHFSELGRGIPALSPRMLCERVKELAGEGIVTRRVLTGTPVRVVYSLTPKGQALVPIMRGIEKWALQWSDSAGNR